MSPLAAVVLVTALAVTVVAVVAGIARQREAEPDAPWWSRPAVWVGASVTVALLGLFVAPKLLGFTFVFLPFLWIGGLGRRRRDRTDPSDHEV